MGDLIAFKLHITPDQVRKEETSALDQIDHLAESGAAGIDGDPILFHWNKFLFFTGESVVYAQSRLFPGCKQGGAQVALPPVRKYHNDAAVLHLVRYLECNGHGRARTHTDKQPLFFCQRS